MNPHAKEFVPAHIKKKREEEADLSSQLGDVHIAAQTNSTSKTLNENGDSSNITASTTANCNGNSTNTATATTTTTTTTRHNNQHHNDLEDDRYLLKAGENICEFNGEQFIIPGDDDVGHNDNGYNDADEDDEYANHHAPGAGYDFGNAEDNEDEDVCNAFEEFLENLPDGREGGQLSEKSTHNEAGDA